MAIESICAECGKRLRVGDEYAHEQARCPCCGHIYTVPGSEEITSSPDRPNQGPVATDPSVAPAVQAADDWYLHTSEGRIYGPVNQSQLDQWVREGRVTAECQLGQGPHGPWQWASTVYGVLAQNEKPAAVEAGNPFAGGLSTGPVAVPGHQPSRPRRKLEPHRGGIVLVLGILSFMVPCPILGVVAWWMGNDDLNAMSRGRMDRSGLGITQAGRVLGTISTILWIVSIAAMLFVMLLFGFAA